MSSPLQDASNGGVGGAIIEALRQFGGSSIPEKPPGFSEKMRRKKSNPTSNKPMAYRLHTDSGFVSINSALLADKKHIFSSSLILAGFGTLASAGHTLFGPYSSCSSTCRSAES